MNTSEDAASPLSRRQYLSAGLARSFDREVDVVVVGSGMAGSSSALFAREAGAAVLVVEKGPASGGTSAKSAGQIWIPANPAMKAAGLDDPKPGFLDYVTRYSYPALYDPDSPTLGAPELAFAQMNAFYDNAAPALAALTAMGAVSYGALRFGPDDHTGTYNYGGVEHDSRPYGRSLMVLANDGSMTGGSEAMSRMAAALKARDVPILLGHGATDILRNAAGEVIGIEARNGDARLRIRARRGVIFASGGYWHNEAMRRSFQPYPSFGSCSVPGSAGDFATIGMRAGAKLGNMAGAWRAEVVLEDALRYESQPEDVFVTVADSFFYVNKYGHRFVNERRNYHDRALACYSWDSVNCEFPNLVHFFICDERARLKFGGLYPLPAGGGSADYLVSAPDFDKLAAAISERLASLKIGAVPSRLGPQFAANLAATAARFNEFARTGKDRDFERGDRPWERAWAVLKGAPSAQFPDNDLPNKTLYPLSDSGPYHAIILAPGILDTNGGPMVDAGARVLDQHDRPIPGLYGVGNCIASPAANAYWGAGVTLGLGMTFGMIAGRGAAAQPVKGI